MKVQLGLYNLRSKVARRLVTMVAVLVLAPTVMTGVISYLSVDAQVRADTDLRLHEAARSYLLEIIGRLRMAASLLRGRLDTTAADQTVRKVLDDIAVGTVAGDTASLPDDLAAAVHALARNGSGDKVAAVLRTTGTSGREIYLVMVGPQGVDQQFISARVQRNFLWESAAIMPFRYIYCITTSNGAPVFCPADAPFRQEGDQVPLAAATLSSPRETAHASADDQAFSLRAWRAPMILEFDTLDLAVSVAAPESVAYLAQASFRKSVGPSLGIAALSAILLAIVLIRRRLHPLDQLTAAASRMAGGDFSRAVQVDADDEFLGLASMFNDMRQRLGRQFAEMGLLASLDRNIARLKPLPRLVENLLTDLGRTFPGQQLMIAIPDGSMDRRASTFLLADGRIELGRCAVALGTLGESWRTEPEIGRMLRWPTSGAPDGTICAWARGSDHIVALIVANPPTSGELAAELNRLIQQVADRIAVAAAQLRHQDRLYALGHFDDLTGLANRHLLRDRLRQWVAGAAVAETCGQLLFVDLDGFKHVNDAKGHATGDDLLREAARRLKDCTREQDTVARLGGDEFVLLFVSCPAAGDELLQATRILERLRQPFQIGSSEHYLTASIGVMTLDSECGDDVDALISHADMAMYEAKIAGGNRAISYQPDMQEKATRRTADEAALRDAIARSQFRLYYQPRLDLRTGKLAGAEALLRWERPGAGLVEPSCLIPLAEETGLIREIGAWVIAEACRAYKRWIDRGLCLSEVSVNVSLRQLRDDDFVDSLAGILAATGMPPGVLILEVTESLMAEDLLRASRRLQAVRATGVRISIDDFGTGYSSLSYLREFPIDEIKVDRAFLNGVPGTVNAERIVESIIQLGSALQKNVVVEGVERRDQYEFLERAGCPQIQGYYLAKPLPEESFVEFALRPQSPRLRSVA